AGRNQVTQERGELELGEERAELLRVRPLPAQALQVERDGQIAADGREILREPRRLRLARERLAELLRAADGGALDRIQVREDLLHRPELAHQRRGRLLANAGDARDVVDRVPMRPRTSGTRAGATPKRSRTSAGPQRRSRMVSSQVVRSSTSCIRSLSPVTITVSRPAPLAWRASVPITSSASTPGTSTTGRRSASTTFRT